MLDRLHASLDLALFAEYADFILPGLLVNFEVFLCAATLAIAIGFCACLLRTSRWPVLRLIGALHTEAFRNAPEYVLVMWFHYVVPVLLARALATTLDFPAFVSAFIALGLASSGYFSETFRAGIQAIPRGQIEAATALGMSRTQTMARIILPQVARMMLPESLNNLVSLFKATTIVSLIAVPDVLYKVQMVNQQEMRPLPLYTGAALLYFLVILAMSTTVRAFSERWRTLGRS